MQGQVKRNGHSKREAWIAGFSIAAILLHLVLRYLTRSSPLLAEFPLYSILVTGGIVLVFDLFRKLIRREFGSDLLAGVSIVTAVLLEQYLVAVIVVLMLSGGAALEDFAKARASSVLSALARRMPSVAHRKTDSGWSEVKLDEIRVGDQLVVFPHEICPVDGIVVEGHGVMDESYLTGEPYEMSKTPGAQVISGAINGEMALVIETEKVAADSRYARITQVMHDTEQQRPRLRRLGDMLGAWYTPLALLIAVAAAYAAHDTHRFLAVIVVATPCPLLIAIPTAVIGAISLSARRAIIIKNPAVLEQIDKCETLIFDKTGTLTYGKPSLSEIVCGQGFEERQVLRLAATLEQYSKHPLAGGVLSRTESEKIVLRAAESVSERPGEGLRGKVDGHAVEITGRKKVDADKWPLPPAGAGLECLVFIDGAYAATLRFRDTPRKDSLTFVQHLGPKHGVKRIMVVSGDRESEVRYLAEGVGISQVHAGKSPEEKVAIVKDEVRKGRTLFVGDGINDAPALMAATVGVGFGSGSDIMTEAADAVVLETSLGKIDELIHIGRRMRRIALQSALGGMGASVLGMIAAAAGYLSPIGGAIAQEVIDVAAVLNAVRVALPTKELQDF